MRKNEIKTATFFKWWAVFPFPPHVTKLHRHQHHRLTTATTCTAGVTVTLWSDQVWRDTNGCVQWGTSPTGPECNASFRTGPLHLSSLSEGHVELALASADTRSMRRNIASRTAAGPPLRNWRQHADFQQTCAKTSAAVQGYRDHSAWQHTNRVCTTPQRADPAG